MEGLYWNAPFVFNHDHNSSTVAASNICHGTVHIEHDHGRCSCREEIAFCPAEIADNLSGVYSIMCGQRELGNFINHHSHKAAQHSHNLFRWQRFLLEGQTIWTKEYVWLKAPWTDRCYCVATENMLDKWTTFYFKQTNKNLHIKKKHPAYIQWHRDCLCNIPSLFSATPPIPAPHTSPRPFLLFNYLAFLQLSTRCAWHFLPLLSWMHRSGTHLHSPLCSPAFTWATRLVFPPWPHYFIQYSLGLVLRPHCPAGFRCIPALTNMTQMMSSSSSLSRTLIMTSSFEPPCLLKFDSFLLLVGYVQCLRLGPLASTLSCKVLYHHCVH